MYSSMIFKSAVLSAGLPVIWLLSDIPGTGSNQSIFGICFQRMPYPAYRTTESEQSQGAPWRQVQRTGQGSQGEVYRRQFSDVIFDCLGHGVR